MNFDEFRAWVVEVVDDMVVEFMDEPEADVPATAFIMSPEGHGLVPAAHMLVDDETKSIFQNLALPEIIKISKAEAFAFVSVGYQASGMEYLAWRAFHPDARVKDYPAHEEVLTLLFAVAESRQVISLHSVITRYPDLRPELSDWDEFSVEWNGNSGAFVDASMAVMLGERLVTKDMLEGPIAALVNSPELFDEWGRVMEELGVDYDEIAEHLDADDREWLHETFSAMTAALPPEFHAKARALVEEHLPDYGEFIHEENARRNKS